jgi:hypothetical protein
LIAKLEKAIDRIGRLLKLAKEPELAQNQAPIPKPALSGQNAFDVSPILGPAGKAFQHDQIGCTRGDEIQTWQILKRRGSSNQGLFEWQAAKGDVDRHVVGGHDKYDAIAKRKVTGVVPPSLEVRQQLVDEPLVLELRQQREIDVPRLANCAPPNKRQRADEAKPPAAFVAEILNLGSGLIEPIHRRALASIRCISTKPLDKGIVA